MTTRSDTRHSALHGGTHISLAHGNGGKRMRELIDQIFVRHLTNDLLDPNADAAILPPLPPGSLPALTSDGFTVDPLEFPGGDIGSLAIHGTVNDLAVSGAEPLYIALNSFIEEGFEIERLDRVVASIAAAARAACVRVVTGDTKVLRKGEGGGLYLATTGLGFRRPDIVLGLDRILPGDRIIASGPIGDHGTAILLARRQFGLTGDLQSDCTSVLPLARALLARPGLRFMRDPTRGGLASVSHEIVRHTGLSVRLFESNVPIRNEVQAVCEMLGYNPLYLACEGRIVAVVDPASVQDAVHALRQLDAGRDAAEIGVVGEDDPYVLLETELGGERLVEELDSDPLPRIC
ncbi:MAG: hydrogenase expression/formation protein HypE [Bradyrhizobium sp.]|jgi:hydrogenase expression/formation protein HypE|uniref:hydrogenase expression/formation protein HypE n=1 Tax=Bradyrhizobium sp. TaxID=376 RepID=UPI001A25336C|nr:hydrogenase expression/formation protein HypE [Bradyrhizobium sp.]MBJ7402140.1 hydrogenase expression/formation protein HypE [Bradyrhizobium sp.]